MNMINVYVHNLLVAYTTYTIAIKDTTLDQNYYLKVHFWSPNLVIFQRKHLNGVEIHIFFHFQIHTTIV